MTYPENSAHAHYVTVRDPNSDRSGLLLGPYRFRQDAEANVDRARKYAAANAKDGHWMLYGTARVTTRNPKPGRFNHLIGLTPG